MTDELRRFAAYKFMQLTTQPHIDTLEEIMLLPYARRLVSIEAIQIPNQDIETEASPLLLKIDSEDVHIQLCVFVPYPRAFLLNAPYPDLFQNKITQKLNVPVKGGDTIRLYGSLLNKRTNAPSLAAILYYVARV